MPAYLTHRAAGERVADKFGKSDISHKAAFYFGCQGPDILFFRNYQPWRSSKDSLPLGIAMHGQKTKELLAHAFEFLKSYDKEDKDELISYIAGFLTHYTVDKNAHPFVYGKAGKNTNIHNATESMWDSFTAVEQWGIEPQKFDIFSDVMRGDICEGISQWYSSVAKNIYGINLARNAIKQAQLHLAKAMQALMDLKLPQKLLIKVLNMLSGIDLRAMIYPEQRDESLFTGEEYKGMQGMIEKGVEEAAEMISLMLRYINGSRKELPERLGDINFAGQPL